MGVQSEAALGEAKAPSWSARLEAWYRDSFTQLVLMSLTVFAGPGMFNALNSIGLGGDPGIGRAVNSCLNGMFIVSSFLSPMVVNVLGAKWALMLGTLGYPVYSLAMFYHRRCWAVVAGGFLGLTAGLLWTAQGQLMMSYPPRDRVGRFVAIFWGIFNSGGVVGCLMSFGLNFDRGGAGPAAPGSAALSGQTYWTFFAIMCCGIAMSTVLLPLGRVTRQTADGVVQPVLQEELPQDRKLAAPTGASLAAREFRRTLKCFRNRTMVLLIPVFFYSTFFYEYHFGMIGVLFNGRTGSLTAACYWVAQILGSFCLQAFLDWGSLAKGKRMRLAFTGILVYIAATWAYGGYIQYGYRVSGVKQGLDMADGDNNPWPAMLALCLWGFVDSFVQVWCYWTMGQLSEEPEELACFTAFYKLWQNVGCFVSFLLALYPGSYVFSFWTNVVLIGALILPTYLAINSASSCMLPPKDADQSELDSESTSSNADVRA